MRRTAAVKTPRVSCLVAVAVAAALSLSAAARADQQYDLKFHFTPDQQWTFDSASKLSMSIQINNGQQQVQQENNQKRDGKLTVLAAKDGVPSAVKLEYGPDSATMSSQNGQQQNQPFPAAGKAIRVRKDDMGLVTIDGLDSDPATTNELETMIAPDRSIYPPHPVSVGDEWKGDTASMGKQMGWGPNDPLTISCKLAKIVTVADRPAAEVAVSIDGSKAEGAATTHMTMAGTADIDLTTGETLAVNLGGKLAINGQTDSPQGPVPVAGNGTIDIHVSFKPVGGMPNPGVAPSPTPSPMPAPVAGGGADASRYVGTFKNEKITVQLDGKLSGSIVMGSRTFPATAHVDGDHLAGTFDSNGTKFDFTASVNGNAMQLMTGQSTYALQKPAANPLDGGAAAPVNPLAP